MPDIQREQEKPLPTLEAVSEVQWDGQNFLIAASWDAGEITVQVMAAEAYPSE